MRIDDQVLRLAVGVALIRVVLHLLIFPSSCVVQVDDEALRFAVRSAQIHPFLTSDKVLLRARTHRW